MGWRRVAAVGAAVVGGVAAAGLALRGRFARRRAALVASLPTAGAGTGRTYDPEDLAGLPDPVRRYLDSVLSPGQPYARSVRLRQRGEIRIGEDPRWRPFTATQYVATDPPGFVWDASVRMAPLVSARVVDAFVDGEGSLRARLWSAIPVADADPGPALDRAELLRYLAETPWYPTALLPGQGVTWEPIDDGSARATLSAGGTTVSAVFHFEDGEVVRVTADRPQTRPDGTLETVPWTGYWDGYAERNGVRVPTRGEVEWNRPEGDHRYWRGRVERVVRRPSR